MIEIRVPEIGESIQEVQVSQWLKQEGEWIEKDEDLVELESEKAAQALAAPLSGYLQRIHFTAGQYAKVGDVLAEMRESDEKGSTGGGATAAERGGAKMAAAETSKAGRSSTQRAVADESQESRQAASPQRQASSVMPAAERLLHQYQVSADAVTPSGAGGRLLKEDVLRFVEQRNLQPAQNDLAQPAKPETRETPAPSEPSPAAAQPAAAAVERPAGPPDQSQWRQTEVRPMSMIRRTIASRLVDAQRTAALLTTFNEIDMLPVMQLRDRYKDRFQEKHGVKLGFMSFFTKASVEALRRFPEVNAQVHGNDIVFHQYYDVGVAIGSGKGLVVPVLRNVELMSFADVEREIGRLAKLAQDNRLTPRDLEGGTFTISNGGIYGSLLSTPIINPPQSGILGLHAIQERPVARDGQIVIRPMMYVALSYDHRIVDGREAVGFLRTIKEVLEEPARLFLEV